MAHYKRSMKLKHKKSHRKHATARRTRARRGGGRFGGWDAILLWNIRNPIESMQPLVEPVQDGEVIVNGFGWGDDDF